MIDNTSSKHKDRSEDRDKFVASWLVASVGTWIVGMILAFILMVGVFLLMEGDAISDQIGTSIIIYVLILPVGAMMGITQQTALKEHLGIHVRHWWWVTALGWSIGLFLAVNVVTLLRDAVFAGAMPDVFTVLWIAIVMIVPAGGQAWLLRQHLSQVWVYVLAGVVAGLVCGAILRDEPSMFWIVTPIVSSGLSALVLMWLTSPTTARLSLADDKKKK